jgi:hypothetical protein
VTTLFDAWRDTAAEAAPTGAQDSLCAFCAGDPQPATTTITSPRWGVWTACQDCAQAQLATLHGTADTGADWPVRLAACQSHPAVTPAFREPPA